MTNPDRQFKGSIHIAIKLPSDQLVETLAFYRDTLKMKEIKSSYGDIGFMYGSNKLWIDADDQFDTAQVFFEIVTKDLELASGVFERAKIERCDEIEELPDDFPGFWIKNPAGIVHLVTTVDEPSTG